MQPNVYFLINHNQADGTYPVYTKRLFYFNNIGNQLMLSKSRHWTTSTHSVPHMYVFVLIILFSQYGKVFVFVQTPSWVTVNSSPAWHVCPGLKSDLHICWGLDGQYYLSPCKPRPSFPLQFFLMFALFPSHSVCPLSAPPLLWNLSVI